MLLLGVHRRERLTGLGLAVVHLPNIHIQTALLQGTLQGFRSRPPNCRRLGKDCLTPIMLHQTEAVLDPVPLLAASAHEAGRKWEFRTNRLEGETVSIWQSEEL